MIRKATADDSRILAEMAIQMWDSNSVDELETEFIEMLLACENWAKTMGCKEFASDCELDNEESLQFHLKMGFEEVNRIICFTKKL